MLYMNRNMHLSKNSDDNEIYRTLIAIPKYLQNNCTFT